MDLWDLTEEFKFFKKRKQMSVTYFYLDDECKYYVPIYIFLYITA